VATKISLPQLLPGFHFKNRLSFGGSLLDGKRKSARPVDSKQALHLVLRSSQARGESSLLRHAHALDRLLNRQAELHGVHVLDRANAGNHLHLVVRPRSRRALRGFLRSVSGLIARKVLRKERGPAGVRSRDRRASHNFWDARPFSRICPAYGRAYAALKHYLRQNRVEALGFTRPESRDILAFCVERGWKPPA